MQLSDLRRGIAGARRWLCAGIPLLTALACAGSPVVHYQIDVWQTERGLPQNSVTAIAQTADGYLWLGTQDGLARFDGVRFQVFDQNNTPGMRNSRIVQLFEDRKGWLWIGTEQGGVVCLRDGEFTAYEMPSRGTTHNYARVFCNDDAGALWLVSCEWQLIRLAEGVFTVPSSNWNLAGSQCGVAVADKSGRVWIGTERELAAWEKGAFQTVWGGTNGEVLRVDFLAAGREGGCWVAAGGRLQRFDSGRWVADYGVYAWSNRPIYDLREDSEGSLWVATLGSGLFRYDRDGGVLHLTTKEGLPSDFVRCVIEDREGNIWAGTEGGGLCRLKPAVFQTIGVRQGLSSDQVMSVCESAEGGLWVGTNGDGLDRLKDGRVEHFGAGQGLMNGHVWSVLEDRQGAIWVGTWDGLFRRERDRFVCVSDGTNIGWQVLGLYEDAGGAIWVGQQAVGALARMRHLERVAIKIPGASAGLDVRVVVEDSHGNLWIGTNEEGLYRMKSGQFTRYGRQEGLKSEAVWSLLVDRSDGGVWIGTSRGGLSRWHEGRMMTWSTDDGLINNVICQILDDDAGHLWLGSHGGVFRVRKEELIRYIPRRSAPVQCVGYGKADGLPSIECQGGFQPSGCKTRDGRLWFPTVKGLAAVDPGAVARNPQPPPVVIEGVFIDGIVQPLKSGRATARGGESRAAVTLKIPPGRQRMDFHYTALSFTAPEDVRFRYRIEGLEAEWNEAGAQRTAQYGHVGPGDYRFQVVACNNDGVWNETGDSLALTVLPHFWQTKWFLGLSILTMLGIVAVTVRRIEARKLQRQIELVERERAIESERARIAKDIHDDLGANLTEIAILSELAENPASPPGQAQADVRKIASKARELTRSLDEIVWAVNPQYDSLDSLVTYCCDFAQDYLGSAGIHCRMEVPTSLPEVVLTADVRHNLLLTLKEALNNIAKHAGATEMHIRVAIEPDLFTLAIRDNGRGFEPDQQPAGVVAAGMPPASGLGGNGLANMRQRIESIGGQFTLESRAGQGTLVKLTVRLNTR
jgi:ligand-binding sensor domain-containing protein/signal transduction histidine kinase